MCFVEVRYKVNTMGVAVFSNKLESVETNKITLKDFKILFANRHHVDTKNFR